MGNHSRLAREVRQNMRPGWRVLELGAGDGAFGIRLIADGICRPHDITGIDRAPRPVAWPAEAA